MSMPDISSARGSEATERPYRLSFRIAGHSTKSLLQASPLTLGGLSTWSLSPYLLFVLNGKAATWIEPRYTVIPLLQEIVLNLESGGRRALQTSNIVAIKRSCAGAPPLREAIFTRRWYTNCLMRRFLRPPRPKPSWPTHCRDSGTAARPLFPSKPQRRSRACIWKRLPNTGPPAQPRTVHIPAPHC